MIALKTIAGLGCLIIALFIGVFWLASFGLFENVVANWVPLVFSLGLAFAGVVLLVKCRASLSNIFRIIVAVAIGLPLLTITLLDLRIHHDRKALQERAKNFLKRPFPKLLVPDADGMLGDTYYFTNNGPQNTVMGYSLVLIERYANKGRIRWSAVIQGQFAGISSNLWLGAGPKADAVATNEEVKAYVAERNAILAQEWRMGFWQYIQDTIEMKRTIPEIEEEDSSLKATAPAQGTNSAKASH